MTAEDIGARMRLDGAASTANEKTQCFIIFWIQLNPVNVSRFNAWKLFWVPTQQRKHFCWPAMICRFLADSTRSRLRSSISENCRCTCTLLTLPRCFFAVRYSSIFKLFVDDQDRRCFWKTLCIYKHAQHKFWCSPSGLVVKPEVITVADAKNVLKRLDDKVSASMEFMIFHIISQ